ncbi:hypothetical protein L5515_010163 [Caenorhabditis briggsae]|uniref:ELM2 domain-containing protein n=2 Tax=Caenorhabditis briggsae TaxID=6238 RepID=A0AAE9JCU6_CAEBR|nr:hypothetical protein L5515_010163 [Caenorhabditis briggsae]
MNSQPGPSDDVIKLSDSEDQIDDDDIRIITATVRPPSAEQVPEDPRTERHTMDLMVKKDEPTSSPQPSTSRVSSRSDQRTETLTSPIRQSSVPASWVTVVHDAARQSSVPATTEPSSSDPKKLEISSGTTKFLRNFLDKGGYQFKPFRETEQMEIDDVEDSEDVPESPKKPRMGFKDVNGASSSSKKADDQIRRSRSSESQKSETPDALYEQEEDSEDAGTPELKKEDPEIGEDNSDAPNCSDFKNETLEDVEMEEAEFEDSKTFQKFSSGSRDVPEVPDGSNEAPEFEIQYSEGPESSRPEFQGTEDLTEEDAPELDIYEDSGPFYHSPNIPDFSESNNFVGLEGPRNSEDPRNSTEADEPIFAPKFAHPEELEDLAIIQNPSRSLTPSSSKYSPVIDTPPYEREDSGSSRSSRSSTSPKKSIPSVRKALLFSIPRNSESSEDSRDSESSRNNVFKAVVFQLPSRNESSGLTQDFNDIQMPTSSGESSRILELELKNSNEPMDAYNSPNPNPNDETMPMDSSEDQSSEDVRVPEASENLQNPENKRSHQRKNPRPAAEGIRKSRRIIGREEPPKEEEEEELIANFKRVEVPYTDRGVIVPTGLSHTPFSFKEKFPDLKMDRLKDQLTIDMEPVFTPASTSSKYDSPRITGQKRSLSPGPVRKLLLQRGGKRAVRIGPAYQTAVSGNPILSFGDPDPEDRDREKAIFIPLDNTEDTSKRAQTWKKHQDYFYRMCHEIYWRAIWRQFESHIPYETALEHLLECKYDFCKALETIDQKLKVLPQETKPLCMAQAKLMANLVKNEKITRRMLQEKAMRNYHLGEVQKIRYLFTRFYGRQEWLGVPCNCNDFICMELHFEPRVSCTNCNKKYRKKIRGARDKLCMICESYVKVGGTKRPANDVVYTDRELKFLENWERKESEVGRRLEREEAEVLIQEETNARWRQGELTDEERDMLDYKDLRIQNRGGKHRYNMDEQKIRAEKIVSQLQPFIFPHFSRCQCKVSGSVPRHSKNAEKWEWDEEERRRWRDLIVEYDGNQSMVAEIFDVEPGLIERFMQVYPRNHKIWKEDPTKKFVRLHRRQQFPSINLPPFLPDGDSQNSSRDGSPYLPPEEIRAAKKAKKK